MGQHMDAPIKLRLLDHVHLANLAKWEEYRQKELIACAVPECKPLNQIRYMIKDVGTFGQDIVKHFTLCIGNCLYKLQINEYDCI